MFSHDAARLGGARMAELVAAPVGHIPGGEGRPSEPRRFMKMVDGHCVALERSSDGRFSCTVYEDRPTVCRGLEPGTAPCLEARAAINPVDAEQRGHRAG